MLELPVLNESERYNRSMQVYIPNEPLVVPLEQNIEGNKIVNCSCGKPAHFLDLAFETYFCGKTCWDEQWEEYRKAMIIRNSNA